MSKPSIVEVIGARIELRKAGKEFKGLCPFHQDKTPSLYVSEDKGLFHCFGCGESGDVIDFIIKLDGLSFPAALAALGIDTTTGKPLPVSPSRRRAGELAATWAHEQRVKFDLLIIEDLERRDYADEANDFELTEIFDRKLIMLRAFYDSLSYPTGIAQMLGVRASIEEITA